VEFFERHVWKKGKKTASRPMETKKKQGRHALCGRKGTAFQREKAAAPPKERFSRPKNRRTTVFFKKRSVGVFFSETRDYLCSALANALFGEMGEWLKPPVC
jgi:hypothetical protein